MSGLTMADLHLARMRLLAASPVRPSFAGVKIIVSPHALEETDERLFPKSRYRSKRIHKKLCKRFGGEFRKVPCIWKTPQGLVCHPDMYSRLKEKIANDE